MVRNRASWYSVFQKKRKGRQVSSVYWLFWPERYDFNQFSATLTIPYTCRRRKIRMPWSTVSEAALKSRRETMNAFTFVHCSMLVHDYFPRKWIHLMVSLEIFFIGVTLSTLSHLAQKHLFPTSCLKPKANYDVLKYKFENQTHAMFTKKNRWQC